MGRGHLGPGQGGGTGDQREVGGSLRMLIPLAQSLQA